MTHHYGQVTDTDNRDMNLTMLIVTVPEPTTKLQVPVNPIALMRNMIENFGDSEEETNRLLAQFDSLVEDMKAQQ